MYIEERHSPSSITEKGVCFLSYTEGVCIPPNEERDTSLLLLEKESLSPLYIEERLSPLYREGVCLLRIEKRDSPSP